ncbi:hypothetical protein VNI00_014282 [Paramarasmius palmivorus]|uniref:Uncharacterized protein n=1 Tax=Paramarasmius palmivorus TaxID=297713 RepID=A0AAW0BYJ6_9AGAR
MVQLDGDSLLQVAEHHLQENTGWRQMDILLVTRTLLPRLYREFYRHVVLQSSRSMYRLQRTFEEHPDRVPFVKSLWVRVGRDGALAPAARDITYPKGYQAYFKVPVPIIKSDSSAVGQIVALVAPFLTRLTICARLHYPRIREALLATHFPNIIELELPVDLVLSPDSSDPLEGLTRFQKLQKLRIIYNSEKDEDTEILPHQSFTNVRTLTHLYVSYWAESTTNVERNIVNLRVPPSVTVVVLESDTGICPPVRPENIPRYKIHPKVVFLMKKRVFEDMDKVIGHTRRMGYLRDMSFLLDVRIIGESCVWEMGEVKVRERTATCDSYGNWEGHRVIYSLK